MAVDKDLDLELLRDKFTGWLASVLPDADDVTVTGLQVPSAGGMSSQTVLLDVLWRGGGVDHEERLVARIEPVGQALFPSYDLSREFALMKALSEATSVRVPRVRWLEPDLSPLGAPFLIMDRIDGRIPADVPPFTIEGWLADLGADEQARLYDSALQTLAAVHAVDYQALGLAALYSPHDGSSPLDAQLHYYEDYFASAALGQRVPTIESALAWLKDNRPVNPEPTVLNWGDCRLSNVIFGPDLSVLGALDWEMACLGSPELDLGWWVHICRVFTEGLGVDKPPGFPDVAETVSRYEELSGHTVENLDFYEVFAAVRSSVISLRMGNLMIAAGQLPPDSTMPFNNPTSITLARTLGLPEPAGAVTGWY